MILLIASVVFIIISIIARYRTRKIKAKNKIQQGKITYSDLNRPASSLFSKKYRITGKPDYVIKQKKYHLPVEFKTGSQSNPLKNHIFQVAAYCQLIEENYGGFVPYGILVYNNSDQYKIPFDPKTRFELESTIKKMRNTLKTGKITMNHNEVRRCKACSMRQYCNISFL
jgi:CRISPR-associated exonuclease Cas4